MIELELSDKQLQAFELLDDPDILELLYGGGGRSGKTFLGAEYFILKCLEYEGSKWIVGRESLKKLKRTTILSFFKALRIFGLKECVDWRFNAQESIMTFSRANGSWDNPSTIFFEEMRLLPSDPQFDRFGSFDLSGGWIDECQEVNVGARHVLRTRYSELSGVNCDGTKWKLKKGVTLLTCNPKINWIYYDFVQPAKNGTLKEGRAFLPALFTDNPFIDQESYKRSVLSTGDKRYIERILYGNFDFDDDPLLLFDLDSINDMWTNVLEERIGKYLTVDVARMGGDYIVVGYWEGWDLKKVYYWQKAKTTESEEKIIEIRDRHRVPASHVVIDEDGMGGGFVDHIAGSKGFLNNGKVIQTSRQKKVKDDLEKSAITMNYGNLKTQCWFLFAKKVNNSEVRVSETDAFFKEKFIEDLSVIKEKESKTDGKVYIISKDKIKESLGRSSDFGDMGMMRAFFELNPPRKFMAVDISQ